MTSDLRERWERPSESTVADSIPTNVEWYFGDLLETVSADYPVTRRGLVAALAELEAGAREHESLVRDRGEVLEDVNVPGRVVKTPLQVWSMLEETGDLGEDELRAARSVHRRMGVALTGEDPDPEAPFFVFAAESPA